MDNLQRLLKSPRGIDCYLYETIPSTNQKVWDLIDSGVDLPLVAIASQQTAGKGQRGHQWVSNEGGLYLSLGLEVNLAVDCATHLTLWTVWGIANNLLKHQIPVQIKWLNDLVWKGKKLGGILSETRIKNNLIKEVVIGVGINWQNEVPAIGINLDSILKNQVNSPINCLEELAFITIIGIFNGYQYYLKEGLGKLIISYEEILYNLGEKITLEAGEGIITGIGPKGELKIRLNSQGATTEVLLPPGSVSLGYF